MCSGLQGLALLHSCGLACLNISMRVSMKPDGSQLRAVIASLEACMPEGSGTLPVNSISCCMMLCAF